MIKMKYIWLNIFLKVVKIELNKKFDLKLIIIKKLIG